MLKIQSAGSRRSVCTCGWRQAWAQSTREGRLSLESSLTVFDPVGTEHSDHGTGVHLFTSLGKQSLRGPWSTGEIPYWVLGSQRAHILHEQYSFSGTLTWSLIFTPTTEPMESHNFSGTMLFHLELEVSWGMLWEEAIPQGSLSQHVSLSCLTSMAHMVLGSGNTCASLCRLSVCVSRSGSLVSVSLCLCFHVCVSGLVCVFGALRVCLHWCV